MSKRTKKWIYYYASDLKHTLNILHCELGVSVSTIADIMKCSPRAVKEMLKIMEIKPQGSYNRKWHDNRRKAKKLIKVFNIAYRIVEELENAEKQNNTESGTDTEKGN